MREQEHDAAAHDGAACQRRDCASATGTSGTLGVVVHAPLPLSLAASVTKAASTTPRSGFGSARSARMVKGLFLAIGARGEATHVVRPGGKRVGHLRPGSFGNGCSREADHFFFAAQAESS